MWLSFILCLLIFSASDAIAQQNNQSILRVNFEPSFSNNCTLTLHEVQGGIFWIELVVFKFKENSKIESREEVDVSQDKAIPILDFLKTYNFIIKGSIDTISVERVFWRGDSVTAIKKSYGNDGITVNGSFTKGGVTKRFAFWSPEKDSENYQFVQKILALPNESFKKKKSLNQLKALQSYF
ncbi:MAG TPA: hypothetical protein VFU05_05270 [Cyclobacteriaceae bacterium]|nr:hypothetical protein [Cyclobacteriaceae bacterium]